MKVKVDATSASGAAPGGRAAVQRELEMVIAGERAKEDERQAVLRVVTNAGERARLVAIFTAERASAKVTPGPAHRPESIRFGETAPRSLPEKKRGKPP